MKRVVLALVITVLGVIGFSLSAYALDPPHNFSTNKISCTNGTGGQIGCHDIHDAEGGAITKIAGNFNLCFDCHNSAGIASNKPFADGDQALPAPGLPSGVSATGTSHRWDSGVAGHVEAVGTPSSTGTVQSTGAFTGRYAKTYTITTTGTPGQPTTTFSWNCRRWPDDTDAACGSGTGSTTGTVLLNEGVSVTFTGAFVAGDQWRIFVRTDINHPASAALRTVDGKIMCSSCHNQHKQAAQPFDPNAPDYGGSGTGAGRHFQRLDNYAQLANPGGNAMCLDCHSARDVTASSGGSHPVGLAKNSWSGLFKARASITLPLDKGIDGVADTTDTSDDRIQCLSCHQPHYAATSDGTLLRTTNITSLCTNCHDNADTTSGSHLDTSTGVLWPGGQYSVCVGGANVNQTCDVDADCPSSTCGAESTFPQITDTARTGWCTNCHQPHGWVDATNTSQDYSNLLVDKQENLCYSCHDGTVTTTVNVYAQFTGGICQGTGNAGELCKVDNDCPSPTAGACSVTNFQDGIFNQRHDVSDADQTFSQGVVECVNCHNPHLATGTNKLINPDGWSDGTTTFVAGQPFTKTYAPGNQYNGNSYRSAASDLDPVNPEGLPAGPSIGPAVEGVHNGDDLGTSNQDTGTYTGTEDLTYTVTISPGGTPGAGAGISVTTGSSTECPVGSPCTASVTAFDTFVNVGNFGVQIKFQDGGSGGTPSSIEIPNCNNPVNQGAGHTCTGVNNNISNDDTATSSGTYTGPSIGTYTLRVTTAGCVQGVSRCPNTGTPEAVITCTSDISGDACNPSTTYLWPNPPTTPISIGSYGVQVTISDSGTRDRDWELELDQQWTIGVNPASGDTILGSGTTPEDTWTIVVSAGGATFSEPDYIAFCLTCHDESPPPGVTMPSGLTNIAADYFGNRMGAAAGGTGTSIGNGYLKEPWTDQTAHPGEDPTAPYAALNCTVCHEGHGSNSLYHLRTSITVGGVALEVGGETGSQFGVGSADPVTGTTYSLPLIGGVQQAQYFGAWCTFCHEMSNHPAKVQTDSCPNAHKHTGANF